MTHESTEEESSHKQSPEEPGTTSLRIKRKRSVSLDGHVLTKKLSITGKAIQESLLNKLNSRTALSDPTQAISYPADWQTLFSSSSSSSSNSSHEDLLSFTGGSRPGLSKRRSSLESSSSSSLSNSSNQNLPSSLRLSSGLFKRRRSLDSSFDPNMHRASDLDLQKQELEQIEKRKIAEDNNMNSAQEEKQDYTNYTNIEMIETRDRSRKNSAVKNELPNEEEIEDNFDANNLNDASIPVVELNNSGSSSSSNSSSATNEVPAQKVQNDRGSSSSSSRKKARRDKLNKKKKIFFSKQEEITTATGQKMSRITLNHVDDGTKEVIDLRKDEIPLFLAQYEQMRSTTVRAEKRPQKKHEPIAPILQSQPTPPTEVTPLQPQLTQPTPEDEFDDFGIDISSSPDDLPINYKALLDKMQAMDWGEFDQAAFWTSLGKETVKWGVALFLASFLATGSWQCARHNATGEGINKMFFFIPPDAMPSFLTNLIAILGAYSNEMVYSHSFKLFMEDLFKLSCSSPYYIFNAESSTLKLLNPKRVGVKGATKSITAGLSALLASVSSAVVAQEGGSGWLIVAATGIMNGPLLFRSILTNVYNKKIATTKEARAMSNALKAAFYDFVTPFDVQIKMFADVFDEIGHREFAQMLLATLENFQNRQAIGEFDPRLISPWERAQVTAKVRDYIQEIKKNPADLFALHLAILQSRDIAPTLPTFPWWGVPVIISTIIASEYSLYNLFIGSQRLTELLLNSSWILSIFNSAFASFYSLAELFLAQSDEDWYPWVLGTFGAVGAFCAIFARLALFAVGAWGTAENVRDFPETMRWFIKQPPLYILLSILSHIPVTILVFILTGMCAANSNRIAIQNSWIGKGIMWVVNAVGGELAVNITSSIWNLFPWAVAGTINGNSLFIPISQLIRTLLRFQARATHTFEPHFPGVDDLAALIWDMAEGYEGKVTAEELRKIFTSHAGVPASGEDHISAQITGEYPDPATQSSADGKIAKLRDCVDSIKNKCSEQLSNFGMWSSHRMEGPQTLRRYEEEEHTEEEMQVLWQGISPLLAEAINQSSEELPASSRPRPSLSTRGACTIL